MESDTIAAISTPPGAGGIAIIRISGENARAISKRLFRPSKSGFRSHELRRGFIVDPVCGHTLDEALVSVMPKPNSYTREDVVEINSHSGPAVVREILELIIKNGARLAEPGEFTKRAFLNGRIDLTQAEAVIDIIQSKSASSLKAAAKRLTGDLNRYVNGVKEALLTALAQIEASIDFSEMGHEPEDDAVSETMAASFEADVVEKLADISDKYEGGRLIREGIRIGLAGKPNVGKSSLINALLGYDRAIVAASPGTTRDYISEPLVIGGVHVTIIDTAGLRESGDPVERVGIEKTREAIDQSDIVLFMVDGADGMTEDDDAVYETFQTKNMIRLVNKTDKMKGRPLLERDGFPEDVETVYISALRGDGLDDLKDLIFRRATGATGFDFDHDIALNLRQKREIDAALEHSGMALELIRAGDSPELAAIEINDALERMNRILGLCAGDDVLDRIFQTFCIGK